MSNTDPLADFVASSVVTDCVAGTTAFAASGTSSSGRSRRPCQGPSQDHPAPQHGLGDEQRGRRSDRRHPGRFEADMGMNSSTWTKPTAIESPDASKTHTPSFKVGQDGLVRSLRVRRGSFPLDVTRVPAAFIAEFAAHMAKHELADLIVLEVVLATLPSVPALTPSTSRRSRSSEARTPLHRRRAHHPS